MEMPEWHSLARIVLSACAICDRTWLRPGGKFESEKSKDDQITRPCQEEWSHLMSPKTFVHGHQRGKKRKSIRTCPVQEYQANIVSRTHFRLGHKLHNNIVIRVGPALVGKFPCLIYSRFVAFQARESASAELSYLFLLVNFSVGRPKWESVRCEGGKKWRVNPLWITFRAAKLRSMVMLAEYSHNTEWKSHLNPSNRCKSQSFAFYWESAWSPNPASFTIFHRNRDKFSPERKSAMKKRATLTVW